ncbi:MAG: SufD family Fe-S cluster assembly protein [Acholeplasmatales bacterium]|nr:SufD family Fe-S cluster assembly protein [Acholeplasmatales bacterium]
MDLIINENKEYLIPSDVDVNILVKKNINATLIEHNKENRNLKIDFEDNAIINYLSVDLSKDSKKEINLKQDDNLEMILSYFNGGKKEIIVNLDKENSNINIKSIIMMKNDKENESINVYHNAKNTTSNIENYITSNKAKIDIDVIGKIKKNMSNSNCAQKSRGIVLTDDAYIKVMPVLLIDEYDVKANHGAAIGKIDDEGMYYLMSRGISKKDAEMLIIKGFLSPILKEIKSEEMKEELIRLQDERL